jgi:hypothetical protein
LAAKNGKLEVVKLLIEKGANVQDKNNVSLSLFFKPLWRRNITVDI